MTHDDVTAIAGNLRAYRRHELGEWARERGITAARVTLAEIEHARASGMNRPELAEAIDLVAHAIAEGTKP